MAKFGFFAFFLKPGTFALGIKIIIINFLTSIINIYLNGTVKLRHWQECLTIIEVIWNFINRIANVPDSFVSLKPYTGFERKISNTLTLEVLMTANKKTART